MTFTNKNCVSSNDPVNDCSANNTDTDIIDLVRERCRERGIFLPALMPMTFNPTGESYWVKERIVPVGPSSFIVIP